MVREPRSLRGGQGRGFARLVAGRSEQAGKGSGVVSGPHGAGEKLPKALRGYIVATV